MKIDEVSAHMTFQMNMEQLAQYLTDLTNTFQPGIQQLVMATNRLIHPLHFPP